MLGTIARRSAYAGLTFAALLLGFFVTQMLFADNLHAIESCPMQTWAVKTGPNGLFAKSYTSCLDSAPQDMQHYTFTERFNWETGLWEQQFSPAFGTSSSAWWQPSIAHSVIFTVEDYLGLLCYRMRTHHFVLELFKGVYWDGFSSSTAHCY